MSAPPDIASLVRRFEEQSDAYKSGQYNEAQLRQEFIDPMFKALGWDMENVSGYAEAYKDVIHEDAIKIGGATKAPDYCFRIGGTRKFFLEAKKPSVDIKGDASPAFQLRRYAWSAKLPLSILTDFEELAVYDCRIEPRLDDKASAARVLYLTFQEYVSRWDDIAKIFARESILKGSFDKFADSTKAKRGTAEVDAAFLWEIERWRADLAKNLALRNPKLSQRDLNFAVQRTIDRIVFLRICEDRRIEVYGRLQALLNGEHTYDRMRRLFYEADDRYNSGLFHFRKEKDRLEPPDDLTPSLEIDDAVLKKIIQRLYYPQSPYEFSVLPADILGQVYEQFLGKVIRLTEGHQAKVEDKPEVKKAGGVYYTPTYIVDYIVENTVGKLLKNKTPVQTAKLRILDPACGSGSFLIGAYQCLLDWHRDWYVAHEPKKLATGRKALLYQGIGGEWKLTTSERKRILLQNIYGVDIDAQAVETTKLSLLLKVLEGESEQTLATQLRFFHERALPDLGRNIRCGNSLIGPDFYQQSEMLLLDEEQRYRINVFEWNGKDGFPEIMKDGGFDAVIGNPPYVDIKALPDLEAEYIFATYPSANNRINLFAAFLERSLSLVKESNFRMSMIVPTAVLTQASYKELRERIIGVHDVSHAVRIPNESFGAAAGNVKVDTVILVFEPKSKKKHLVEIVSYAGYQRISRIDPGRAHVHARIPRQSWAQPEDFVWALNLASAEDAILRKCEHNSVQLEKCAEFSLGLTPYDKYKGHTPAEIEGEVFHADRKINKTFKPLLRGNDVTRYCVNWNGSKWISYGPWLGAPREQRFFTQKRILVKQIIDWTTKRIWAAITDEELYNTQNAFNLLPKDGWRLEYLLGIINSGLMTFYHRKKFLDEFKMRFQKILIKDCRRFPIHLIASNKLTGKNSHDRMVSLVELMLELHKQRTIAKTDHAKIAIQRQIDAIDAQIDQLVYDLYELTPDEIKIVREATK